MAFPNTQRNTVFIAITALMSTFSLCAQAQQPMIEEVMVTAQKREQNAQDVPIALTAIDADTIEQAGIQTTQDVVRLAPSLTVNEANHKQTSSFSIRGVGTNVYGIGVEQGVALLVDDVAAIQPGQTLGSLVDIERIEVLRGPQSTLFGKNASAGVISITTKSPSDIFEGAIEGTATDDGETGVVGSVSGPIIDSLRYRLTGRWNDRDGYIDNLTPNVDDKNGARIKNLRGKLDWDITDAITVKFSAYSMKDKSKCCALTWESMPVGNSILGLPIGYPADDINPGKDNFDFRGEDGPYSESESTGGSVRLHAAVGEFELVSISALDNWNYDIQEDVDFSDLDVLGFFSAGQEQGGWYSSGEISTNFYSQEFRLLSPSYEKYEYLVGLYYANAKTTEYFFRNLSLALADNDTTAKTESLSVFGQLTWHFTTTTSITGGLRWLNEEISADLISYLDSVPEKVSGNDSDSPIVGRVSLQHFFRDEIMTYASYARGYKGQAFDIGGGRFSEYAANNPIDSESSNSYEIGVKSILWDKRLQLNADVFYTTYEDFQVQRTDLIDGVVVFELDNVGELVTQGIELDSLILLSENIALTMNASYIDASANDYDGAACWSGQTVAEGCVLGLQNVDNGKLPVAPEWKYTAMLDYTVPLDSLPFNAFANIIYTWQDDVIFNINQDPSLTQGSYGLTNLRFGLNDKKGRYRITFFANNLFDEAYAGNKINLTQLFAPGLTIGQVLPRSAQRYAGVQARYSF
ncbi:MAG: TonB-dependent receptor [Halioglobus sp.]|nr:TonB-dependent receptor [Halioglobus sp.]